MSTILIADATDAFRRMLRSILEIRNHSVVEASNGEQVMDALQQQTSRIIVLFDNSLTVAGKSIVDALTHLIDHHAFVIMHTYDDHPASAHLPSVLHIEKPFTVDALHNAILQAGTNLA